MTPLLLLVDLQQDYLEATGLEPGAGQIVGRAVSLLEGCRALNIPVVHVWTTVSRANDQRMPHWRQLGRWICEEGTPGHRPPPALLPHSSETVVHKQFFSAFSNDTLAPLLAARGIDTVIIAGIHLHACVRETVLGAYERGCQVWVAEDAVGSDDPLHAAITRRYLQARAAQFAPVEPLLEMLRVGTGIPVPPPDDDGDGLVTAASRRAREAGLAWVKTDPSQRRDRIESLALLLKQKVLPLADQMARDIGKPVTYGRGEVERTVDLVRAIAAQPLEAGTLGPVPAARRQPVGVIAIITPWNNPVLIPLGKIIAALFYGNTVVWKPAPAALAVAHKILAALRAAGFPEDVVQLLRGDQRCGAALMSDARVDAVTLTGGALAGRCAQEICGRRHVPLQAELGGNNVAIVWPDCDLDDATRRIAEGAFGQAGQRCTANRRAIVHAECYEVFLNRLAQATAALPWGDPTDPKTRIGPMISPREHGRVTALVERARGTATRIILPHGSARERAASLELAGAATRGLPVTTRQHADPSAKSPMELHYPPTIICADDPAAEIVQEESFGPVLVVQKAGDWEQAIALANGVRQGLVAAVFTRSAELQQQFLHEAQAGILKINQATADADVSLPFGGWKSSGVGPPEHGIADRDFYTRLQAIYPAPPPA